MANRKNQNGNDTTSNTPNTDETKVSIQPGTAPVSGQSVAEGLMTGFRQGVEDPAAQDSNTIYNQMVTASLRMHIEVPPEKRKEYLAPMEYSEGQFVTLLNPNLIPQRWDFQKEFRIVMDRQRYMVVNAGIVYMVVNAGIVYMYKDAQTGEPKPIGTATLEPLSIVGTWYAPQGNGTAPIYAVTDEHGVEYSSANMAGILKLDLEGVDAEGNPTTRTIKRLVMRSSRNSIYRDRLRYTREVKDFLAQVRNTIPSQRWTIDKPKVLQGEGALIDLAKLHLFAHPDSKFEVTIKYPEGKEPQGVKKGTKTEEVTPAQPEREVNLDDLML